MEFNIPPMLTIDILKFEHTTIQILKSESSYYFEAKTGYGLEMHGPFDTLAGVIEAAKWYYEKEWIPF